MFAFATVVQGQKTNYSDETMSKVRQHNRHSWLKRVTGNSATGEVSVVFDRYWRDSPCDDGSSIESWQRSAVDEKGVEYPNVYGFVDIPVVKGMWTRVNIRDAFFVNNGSTKFKRLTMSSFHCIDYYQGDCSDWNDVTIKWLPYDTIFPAWSAEAYATNSYTEKGSPAIPFTGMTCPTVCSDISFRLIGIVGNSQTGIVTMVVSVSGRTNGSTLTIEEITAFDEDGNPYEKDYGYNATEYTLVPDIEREIRFITFNVPVGTNSFQRIIFVRKLSFGQEKYRVDNAIIQWVSPSK